MTRILKIFCSGAEQDRLADVYRIIERYQGFVLAEVDADKGNDGFLYS